MKAFIKNLFEKDETVFTRLRPGRVEAAEVLLRLSRVRGELLAQKETDNTVRVIKDIDESIIALSYALRNDEYVEIKKKDFYKAVEYRVLKNIRE